MGPPKHHNIMHYLKSVLITVLNYWTTLTRMLWSRQYLKQMGLVIENTWQTQFQMQGSYFVLARRRYRKCPNRKTLLPIIFEALVTFQIPSMVARHVGGPRAGPSVQALAMDEG